MWYTMLGDQTKKSKIEMVWPYIEKAKGLLDTEGVQYEPQEV